MPDPQGSGIPKQERVDQKNVIKREVAKVAERLAETRLQAGQRTTAYLDQHAADIELFLQHGKIEDLEEITGVHRATIQRWITSRQKGAHLLPPEMQAKVDDISSVNYWRGMAEAYKDSLNTVVEKLAQALAQKPINWDAFK